MVLVLFFPPLKISTGTVFILCGILQDAAFSSTDQGEKNQTHHCLAIFLFLE